MTASARLAAVVRDWGARWDRFLFAPVPVTSIAIHRILFGLLVLAWAGLMWPDLDAFYGPAALLSEATAREHSRGLNLFVWVADADRWVRPAWWALVACAAGLTLGLGTRACAAGTFLLLASFAARNPAILNGGDRLLRILAFLLVLSPAGRALSLDRLWRLARGREVAGDPVLHAPWAQRLIQLELSLVYLTTYLWKIANPAWRDGTALYYASRLDDFYRFPVPVLFDHLGAIRLMAWSVLAVEFALGVLIWFRALRYYVLAAGVLLHLGIEYAMNIPLFQWIMIAALATFVAPEAYARGAAGLRRAARRVAGPATPVLFDGASTRCRRLAAVLAALDVLGRLELRDARSVGRWLESPPGFDPACVPDGVLVPGSRGRWLPGFDALRRLSWRLPLLWPVAGFLYVPAVPGIGRAAYARLIAGASRTVAPAAPSGLTGDLP